jgi:hypothetical protein
MMAMMMTTMMVLDALEIQTPATHVHQLIQKMMMPMMMPMMMQVTMMMVVTMMVNDYILKLNNKRYISEKLKQW